MNQTNLFIQTNLAANDPAIRTLATTLKNSCAFDPELKEFFLPVSPEMISTTVEELLNKNGETSSLELRDALRERGYYCTVKQASVCLQQLQSNGDLIRFSKYTRPSSPQASVDVEIPVA